MTARKPVSPKEAIKVLEASEVGVDPAALLLDLAEAGLVKGYARVISRPHAGGEVRDPRIDRDLWRRIIAAGRGSDVFTIGTVRIDEATITAIRFDERSVRTAAAEHGSQPNHTVPVQPSLSNEVSSSAAKIVPKVLEILASSPSSLHHLDRPVAVEEAPPAVAPPAARPAFHIPEGAIVLDTPSAAAALCIGKTKLVSLANEGKIERRNVGRRTVYTVESIRRYLSC